jgi:hypothetical protein
MVTENALKEHMEACEHAYQVMLEENGLLKMTGMPPPEEFLDRKRAALKGWMSLWIGCAGWRAGRRA